VKLKPEDVDEALNTTGIDGRRRAETLSIDEFITLSGSLIVPAL